ncbi:MAG: radical SAM protein [Rhodospirillales bacterium]|nr:radical SAM protein [Rhodospirillales bacterium]
MDDCAPTDLQMIDVKSAKYVDPDFTLDGSPRAWVKLRRLDTLWFNTGTLCNLACQGCYIESSPTNDRLQYLSLQEVEGYLDEIRATGLATRQIGFTGGEPFMNPELVGMLGSCLDRGFQVLLLTNAMRPMEKQADALAVLAGCNSLIIRVSLDHYRAELHEAIRGARSWAPAMRGLGWLRDHGFHIDIACRLLDDETETEMRAGFAGLFRELDLSVDAFDPARLVLFPVMDRRRDVPEITQSCWQILDVDPDTMMCASSRMVVRRKGAPAPAVVPCTLLPYDEALELGAKLSDAHQSVALNHPFCAQFCVLGGANCSAS